jgi:hypothetical protein
MAIEFYLLSRERDALRNKLPRNSPALISLDQAAPIEFSGRTVEPEWAVTCEEHDARVILKAAKKWCPAAVPRITTGFWLKLR